MTSGEPDSRRIWLREALERYERPLVRYAARLTGDADQARDVVQDAFTKLCRQDPARLDGHLAEWLFIVCRNRAIDVRRKETRMTPITAAQVDARTCQERTPPAAVQSAETAGRLARLLGTLSDRQQEALRLKFQEGLRYRQIAAVMDTSASNVGVLIHTAIKALRERMGGEA